MGVQRRESPRRERHELGRGQDRISVDGNEIASASWGWGQLDGGDRAGML